MGSRSVSHQFFYLHEPWNPVYQTEQVSKNAAISHFHRCPPFNLLRVICMAKADTVLLFPLFFCPSPTVGVGLLVWVQFLIHIGSGRWIWSSCSPSLFHFKLRLLFQRTQSLHSYVKWTNMPGTRGESNYFHKKWWKRNSILFLSAETLIIYKTANMGDVFI